MDVEKIWQRFQTHMEYTDEEMQIFKSDPLKVKMVTQTPDFVKCRVVAEVVESHGCHAKHQVGDRFVMTAGGQQHLLPSNRWMVLVILFLARSCIGFQFIAVAAPMPVDAPVIKSVFAILASC